MVYVANTDFLIQVKSTKLLKASGRVIRAYFDKCLTIVSAQLPLLKKFSLPMSFNIVVRMLHEHYG